MIASLRRCRAWLALLAFLPAALPAIAAATRSRFPPVHAIAPGALTQPCLVPTPQGERHDHQSHQCP
ncbi:hypothetical protein APB27_30970 [Pseudomonas aeruginosa]|nr:hypothetical protein AO903_33320 [Pseudomonas aeruginosa]OPD81625.1 hypothetical protein AO940_29995 [Pseudomonas aeruginosa]OPE32207.1 hypothetical protein APB27_30970 [Pseudomonas aeruginosa]OPE34821.1 hypothetical protein APB45_30630 [Pseudomonas aeruginosa]